MTPSIPGPTSHIYFSQRLRLHYVDWGNRDAPPLLLVHGGRDHCRNWDWFADRYRDRYHVIAPDLRGHGDSAWMVGGNYTLLDYVYDIAQLLHQTALTPVTIVSHSLGGAISLAYTGLYPDHVKSLVAIEGLGWTLKRRREWAQTPPEERTRAWVDELRDLSGRVPRRYKTLEDAVRRMHDANTHLSEEQARHLTVYGTNQNEDGTYSWKFDNYTRANAPVRLSAEETENLHAKITCPTLLVRGTQSWASDPEVDGRIAPFRNARVANINNAGHWVHHDELDQFSGVVDEFLAQ
jgi:pimeloyl-ACP methyl ester carboxylesterase